MSTIIKDLWNHKVGKDKRFNKYLLRRYDGKIFDVTTCKFIMKGTIYKMVDKKYNICADTKTEIDDFIPKMIKYLSHNVIRDINKHMKNGPFTKKKYYSFETEKVENVQNTKYRLKIICKNGVQKLELYINNFLSFLYDSSGYLHDYTNCVSFYEISKYTKNDLINTFLSMGIIVNPKCNSGELLTVMNCIFLDSPVRKLFFRHRAGAEFFNFSQTIVDENPPEEVIKNVIKNNISTYESQISILQQQISHVIFNLEMCRNELAAL